MEDDAVEQSEEDDDEAMRLDSVMDDEGLAEVWHGVGSYSL